MRAGLEGLTVRAGCPGGCAPPGRARGGGSGREHASYPSATTRSPRRPDGRIPVATRWRGTAASPVIGSAQPLPGYVAFISLRRWPSDAKPEISYYGVLGMFSVLCTDWQAIPLRRTRTLAIVQRAGSRETFPGNGHSRSRTRSRSGGGPLRRADGSTQLRLLRGTGTGRSVAGPLLHGGPILVVVSSWELEVCYCCALRGI
jgi:hypothetical protein